MLRSPYDREILRLAAPALGALAAEPLYVLVDTAIVGHLGTTQLAALAIAATVLSSAFTIFNFLTYGTTAHVARLHGAGREEDAAALGAQALWLALAIGARARAVRGRARRAGGAHHGRRRARSSTRPSCTCGSPRSARRSSCSPRRARASCAGVGDLRTPLLILIAAHSVNVVLELLFVYGFDWGLAGSAWGTVIAQAGMGAAFVWVQARASGWEPPNLERIRSLLRDRRRDRGAHDGAARLLPGRLGGAGAGRRLVAGRAPDRVPALRLPRARARRDRDRRAGDGGADARRAATRAARAPRRCG